MNKNLKKLLSIALVSVLLVTAAIVSTVFVAADDTTPPVAQIGMTSYETFAEAVKAVPKNTPTTITLLRDAETSVMVGHQYTQDITVDLGGHTLYTNGIVLTSYRNGTTLTVQNGTIKGNATTGSLRATYGGKIILGENLTVTAAGGSATLVYVDNGKVEIAAENGVKFTGGKYDFRKKAEAANNIISVEAGINVDFDETNKLVVRANQYRTYFSTLSEAVAKSLDGDKITLISNVSVDKDDAVLLDGKYNTFFLVEKKNITIDLNGMTVYGDAAGLENMLVGMFATDNNGHLVLTDHNHSGKDANHTPTATVKVDSNGANVYALIVNYEPGCEIQIHCGNYILDKASDSLLYTGGNEGIHVYGGNFQLGNVGTGKNQSPWIFNAKGQNTAHVLVSGGTFNADIQHQYYPFEVLVDKDVALVKSDTNNDGVVDTYTSAPAVAYVTEREWSSKWYTNEIGYATLEEAFAACQGPQTKVYYKKDYVSEQEVVVLLGDIELDADNTITIPADASIVLDLNTHTISGVSDDADKNDDGKLTSADNEVMFDVRGTITVKNGTVTIEHTSDNLAWNGCTEVFYVGFNGTLNVENATIENLGGSDMAYAIDVVNATNATLNINNSTIKSTYIPVRIFNNSNGMNNVTIENSTIAGVSRALWVHIYSSKDNGNKGVKDYTLNLDIFGNGNTYTAKNADRLIEFGFDNAINFDANGNFVARSEVALRYGLSADYETIKLGADIELDEVIVIPADKKVTLDLNGYDIKMSSDAPVSMITNNGELTVKGNSESEIAYNFTGTPTTAVAANTIANRGILVIDGAKISNVGSGNQIGYAIDNYNGAVLTVESGDIVASGSSYYDAIRLFCGSKETTVTVNGGHISSIWAQNPSANKATKVNGTVIVNGGNINVVYYENYTTVKVAADITVNVSTYGVGTPAEVIEADGYLIYSFVN